MNVWPEADLDELRILWASGLSTAEIGRRLGYSKNAIVGKANRLELERRPSPIRYGCKKEVVVAPQPIPPALPPLPSTMLTEPQVVERIVRPFNPEPIKAPAPIRVSRQITCCWPFGQPGTKTFRFCDETDVLLGKPYCVEHVKLAYVHVRDRKEDVA